MRQKVESQQRRFEVLQERLLGTALPVATEVIDSPAFAEVRPSVVFLVRGLDCDTCVAKGFSFARRLQAEFPDEVVFAVGCQTNPGLLQMSFGWDGFVFLDDEELIRKELKFVLTPVFLFLDEDRVIRRVWFPSLNQDDPGEAAFFEYCKDHL